MSGETKKSLKSVVCAGIAILAIAGCATANLVDSNSIVQDGIEYYIQTDKSVYSLGENVEMLYRVTNLTGYAVYLGKGSQWPSCYHFIVKDDGDNEVWHRPRQLPSVPPVAFVLDAYESREYERIWNMMNDNGTWFWDDDFPVGHGLYSVVGELWVGERHPVSVEIEIIPEPCSLVLLGAGLLSVILYRKERTKR